MTPVTVYDIGPMGETPCPVCGLTVYVAWDDEMNRIALDPDDGGAVAVALDGNSLPWCRDVAGKQLAFGEALYRPHDPGCPGLATVTPIDQARSRRVPPPRRATTARRAANAR